MRRGSRQFWLTGAAEDGGRKRPQSWLNAPPKRLSCRRGGPTWEWPDRRQYEIALEGARHFERVFRKACEARPVKNRAKAVEVLSTAGNASGRKRDFEGHDHGGPPRCPLRREQRSFYRLPSTSVPLTGPRHDVPEYGMRKPVGVISTVPASATAQLLLPGTDAVAVPVQLIVLPLIVACAVPLPDICTLPLQVAAKVPETEVADTLVIVHVKPPHVPDWDDIGVVDAHAPALRLEVSSDDVADGDVAVLPHAAVTSSAARNAADRILSRMGKL